MPLSVSSDSLQMRICSNLILGLLTLLENYMFLPYSLFSLIVCSNTSKEGYSECDATVKLLLLLEFSERHLCFYMPLRRPTYFSFLARFALWYQE